MLKLRIEEIASMCEGELLQTDENFWIEGVSTDTRTIRKGMIFLPLIGSNFDGHQYITTAIEKGAAAVICDKHHDYPKDIPVIVVGDTKETLFRFAKNYREYLGLKVIGITGSNGKTTTKDIMYSLLREQYRVAKTKENFNNEIGLSQTILDISEDTDIAILEMGIENFHEMTLLTSIAQPDIAIITNIAESHLMQLKTKENVARAKLEILKGLKEGGIFLYNYDDPALREVIKEFDLPKRTFGFGTDENADFKLSPLKYDETGNTFNLDDHLYTVPLLGEHQMYNGACAILAANFFRLDYGTISRGLQHIELTGMRNEMIYCDGFHILNDCYKSNPQSLNMALATAYGLAGYSQKIAVIGDMLELGENEIEIHKNIGREINPEKIDYLLTLGELSYYIHQQAAPKYPEHHAVHFQGKDELIEKLKEILIEGSLVVIKASHAMKFQEITDRIRDYSIFEKKKEDN